VHWRLADPVRLVLSLHSARADGVDGGRHLDHRGMRRCPPVHPPCLGALPHGVRAAQVDLPVNSRIEYKYVILEEQARLHGVALGCPRGAGPAGAEVAPQRVARGSRVGQPVSRAACAGLDKAGERGRGGGGDIHLPHAARQPARRADHPEANGHCGMAARPEQGGAGPIRGAPLGPGRPCSSAHAGHALGRPAAASGAECASAQPRRTR
jgi:hypothetical protein